MKRLLLLFGILSCWMTGYSQVTYTFTTAGATGNSGPSQANINNAYAGTSLDGTVTSVNGIQEWVVPQSGLYRISAKGGVGGTAIGASTIPGKGALIEGDFFLSAGEVLHILVGQKGQDRTNYSAGGGGGSFVTKAPHNTNASILVIAGGGGAASGDFSGMDASADSCSTFDVQSGPADCTGLGGVSFTGNSGGAGGGFFTDGAGGGIGHGGKAYINGGTGGTTDNSQAGGFGGGGGQDGTGTFAGSGGGKNERTEGL